MSLSQDSRCLEIKKYFAVKFMPDYNFESMKQSIFRSLDSTSDSSDCVQQLEQISQDVDFRHDNGTKFLQSFGASPATLTGFKFTGNNFAYGSKTQCQSAYEVFNMYDYKFQNHLETSLCKILSRLSPSGQKLLSIQPWYSDQVYIGQDFCLPRSCIRELPPNFIADQAETFSNLKSLAYLPENWTYFDPEINLTCPIVSQIYCESNFGEDYSIFAGFWNLDWYYRISMTLLLILVFCVLENSIRMCFYTCKNLDKSKSLKITPFAIQHAYNSIFNDLSSGAASKKNEIQAFHGLRTLSCIWIIVFHGYDIATKHFPNSMSNILEINEYNVKNYLPEVFKKGHLAVNTFFILGGFLAGMILRPKQLKLKSKISELGQEQHQMIILLKDALSNVVNRYCRLVPNIVGVLLFLYVSKIVPGYNDFNTNLQFYMLEQGCHGGIGEFSYTWYGTLSMLREIFTTLCALKACTL